MTDLEEEYKSQTSEEIQKKIEQNITSFFNDYNYSTKKSDKLETEKEIKIKTDNHIHFINKMITLLPEGYTSLESGMPWFAYWSLNTFDLFGKEEFSLGETVKNEMIKYLKQYLHVSKEGFSGYFNNSLSHIMSNYAALLAIVCLDCKEAYEMIDRDAMRRFIMSMKQNWTETKYEKDLKGNFLIKTSLKNQISDVEVNYPGAFQAHFNGESDLRATYCALVVAYILNILDDDLKEGIAEHIGKCQTFEGGIGPEPYSEAHGGYNFCALASLILLNRLDVIDIDKQVNWLVHRQMTIEGGFQGRTNKLVDSCYSHWQGAVFSMLFDYDQSKFSYNSEMLFDQYALQAYILFACQCKYGIVDKPGKRPDLFHLNYGGMGFSLSQKTGMTDSLSNEGLKLCLSYDNSCELSEMDPIFCVSSKKLKNAVRYYKEMDKEKEKES